MQDEIRAALTQMLTGSDTAESAARLRAVMLSRLMQGRSATDPMAALMRQLLSRVQSPEQQVSFPSESGDSARMLLAAAHAEIMTLRRRQAALAATLGACPDCLGTEPGCPRCAGAGNPGWIDIESNRATIRAAPAIQTPVRRVKNSPRRRSVSRTKAAAREKPTGA